MYFERKEKKLYTLPAKYNFGPCLSDVTAVKNSNRTPTVPQEIFFAHDIRYKYHYDLS
jgi:hypothetical protein